MKIIFLAAAASLAAPALAATTTYADRASFDAAVGPTMTETFNSCGVATVSVGPMLSSMEPGPCTGLAPDISYAVVDASNEIETGLYIAAPGQSANLDTALGVDFPSGFPLVVTLEELEAEGSFSFAVDLFQNFGGGTQSGEDADFFIEVQDLGRQVLGSFQVPVASGTGGFFGISSDVAIAYVSINQDGGFAVIDNVSFDSQQMPVIPEPASWALMIAGFGLVGFAARRRAAATA